MPVVTTVHSDYRVDYTGTPLKWLTFGMAGRWALRMLDFYIGVSEDIAGQLVRRRFAPEKIFHVYNGIDLGVQIDRRGEPERAQFFTSLGLDYAEGDVVCGIAARLTRSKDIPTLLRAFAAASARQPKLKLIVAGQGEHAQAYRQLSHRLGLDGRVVFPGWISGMDLFFGCIDVSVLSSLGGEGLSYSILEGARAGCVTISSKDGGLPALIDHGENGLLFDIGDVGGLTDCLLLAAQDDTLRHTFARRLYEKVERGFSLDTMMEGYVQCYERIRSRFVRGKNRGVTLCGAYGMGNAGDDAILEAILREIRECDPDIPIRICSRDPRGTRNTHKVRALHTFNPLAMTHALRRSRLYLFGGGNLLQDQTSIRSLWFYLWTLWLARRFRVSVLMYGCGIGPLRRSRALTAKVLSRCVDAVTLREEESLAELNRLNVQGPQVLLTADPALILPAAEPSRVRTFLRQQGVDPDGRYLCFSLRSWPGTPCEVFSQAAQQAYERWGMTPVFLLLNPKQDEAVSQQVAHSLTCPYHLLHVAASADVTVGMLAGMTAVVAMRLHALILAAGQGVPVVGAAYDPKVSAFLDYIGQPVYTPLGELTVERLLDQLAALEYGREDRLRRMQRLRELEQGNRETLRSMLKG